MGEEDPDLCETPRWNKPQKYEKGMKWCFKCNIWEKKKLRHTLEMTGDTIDS